LAGAAREPGKSRSNAWAEYWGAGYDPQVSSLGDVLAGPYNDLDVQVTVAVEDGRNGLQR
jgi:hypothetical protein